MQMINALSQILDMNGWDPILAIAYNREGSQFRVQTQPRTSVEFIEDVVRLPITVGET